MIDFTLFSYYIGLLKTSTIDVPYDVPIVSEIPLFIPPPILTFPSPVMHVPPSLQNATLHGTDNYEPALKLTNSSNITIQECSFQHSRPQVIVLSEISGYVNINYCKFVDNRYYYKGHGAIVNVFSSSPTRFQLSVNIHACDFINNKGAKSLIHTNNRIFKHDIKLTISSSEFYHSQGVSVHIINQKLYLTGKILFQKNTGEAGI